MNPPLAPKKAFLDSTNFQQNLILEKMGSRFHLESKRLFLGKHREGARKLPPTYRIFLTALKIGLNNESCLFNPGIHMRFLHLHQQDFSEWRPIQELLQCSIYSLDTSGICFYSEMEGSCKSLYQCRSINIYIFHGKFLYPGDKFCLTWTRSSVR